MKPLTWKLFKELFLWALASLLFTQVTISFSTMGLPVLASCVSIERVYALISCQINATKKHWSEKYIKHLPTAWQRTLLFQSSDHCSYNKLSSFVTYHTKYFFTQTYSHYCWRTVLTQLQSAKKFIQKLSIVQFLVTKICQKHYTSYVLQHLVQDTRHSQMG